MQIQITGTKLDLTEALKSYIEEKLSSLSRLISSFESNTEVLVQFELALTTHHHKQGNIYRAEANLSMPGHPSIRVESNTEDAYEAIDKTKNILKHELSKYHDKLTDKRNK